MTRTGLALVAAAAFAVGAADLAVADATIDIAEPAYLTFVEGPSELGPRARWAAGEIDGRGVVFAEYFDGAGLQITVPYTLVHIDNEESNVRQLHDLQAVSANDAGLTFTASDGAHPLTCLAVLWSDASIQCRRDPAHVSKYDPRCVAAFNSNVQQFQCDGNIKLTAAPVIPYERLLGSCAPFRNEAHRMDCVRYGHAHPTRWPAGLAACLDAYRTDDERNFCMFYSFAVVGQTPSPELIRGCKGADDEATTGCVFYKMTGAKQKKGKPGPLLPSMRTTEPFVRQHGLRRLEGARIDVSTGTFQQKTLRATGGMVGDMPVIFVDAYLREKLDWSQAIDRIVLGKRNIALRDLTSVDRVKMNGEILTFRGVYAGKPITCRADAVSLFATCR